MQTPQLPPLSPLSSQRGGRGGGGVLTYLFTRRGSLTRASLPAEDASTVIRNGSSGINGLPRRAGALPLMAVSRCLSALAAAGGVTGNTRHAFFFFFPPFFFFSLSTAIGCFLLPPPDWVWITRGERKKEKKGDSVIFIYFGILAG